jgi:glycosyltransferase involved in cell wall biosynthesis
MKILLTNNHLVTAGGTESYTYAMAHELVMLGHEVSVFTFQTGWFSEKIKELLNIPIITDPKNLGRYDLILANHNTTVEACVGKGFIIQTCHGTLPKLEQPSSRANACVAISWEVCYYLENFGIKTFVINNGIDCERFKPIKPLNDNIQNVLSLCQNEEFNKVLSLEFENRGIGFKYFNKFSNPVWDIENYMNEVDMVISLGRGAYEAMACGRVVLVLDHRPYQEMMGDGIIGIDDDLDILNTNCSGRHHRFTDIDYMIDKAIKFYSRELGDYMRSIALNSFNIKHCIHNYLDIWKRLT